jgi:sarcosine oxidase
MKVATEQFVSMSHADDGPVEVSAEQVQDFYERFVCAGFQGLSSRCVRKATCLYTVVPDHKFVIDHIPSSDRVWFASACSGHGFKHSAAIGEVLAQKALGEVPLIDLGPFKRNRRSLHSANAPVGMTRGN